MSQPLVVVQNNFVTRLTAPLAIATRERGIALHDVSSHEHAGVSPLPPGAWAPVLVVGSVLFVRQWARDDADLARWVFWDDANYDAAMWADRMERRFLNADGYKTTVGEWQRSTCAAMHIRPRSGIKMIGDMISTESEAGRHAIPGLVATPEKLAQLNIDPETCIWVSAPADILSEVRVWMIGGTPAVGSTYRIGGDHNRRADHPYVAECLEAASSDHCRWHPGKHYVVDYALTGEGWRIVEYNPIHSSGWYAADPGAVLDAYLEAEAGNAPSGDLPTQAPP